MPREIVYRKFPTSNADGLPEWATYITNRHPVFKTHDKIGPAKSAVTSNGNGIIFRLFPTRQGQFRYKAVAVINSHEVNTHWYRKAKPDQFVNEVVIFKIEETPLLDVA